MYTMNAPYKWFYESDHTVARGNIPYHGEWIHPMAGNRHYGEFDVEIEEDGINMFLNLVKTNIRD